MNKLERTTLYDDGNSFQKTLDLINNEQDTTGILAQIQNATENQKNAVLKILDEATDLIDLGKENANSQIELIAKEAVDKIREQFTEEIIIKESVGEVAKLFTHTVIWYEPQIHSAEYIAHIQELEKFCKLEKSSDLNKTMNYLKEIQTCVQIIASRTHGQPLVEQILGMPNISKVYIFGQKFPNQCWGNYGKSVIVCDKFEEILQKIRANLIRQDFPAFAPIFDDTDKSENNYLQLRLKGLVNFKNRKQAKNDFLALAKELYPNSKHIEEFQKDYDDYNKEKTFMWYTKESFLYKVVNNCLRIDTVSSIQYCRLILADLEASIKEEYQNKNENFSGVLYRGAFLNTKEWEKLQQNRGKDIEMYGFLSTSKSSEVAELFEKGNEKKLLIKIIVLPTPDKDEQGFVDLGSISKFSSEEEILFNVGSRFTVLEATNEANNRRRLVLLYGGQTMRRYTKINAPAIEIKTGNLINAKCHLCEIKLLEQKQFYVSLSNVDQYTCDVCLTKLNNSEAPALLCLSPSVQKFDQAKDLRIEGYCLKYQNNQQIEFYGYECSGCKQRPSSCLRCLICQNEKKKWCKKCFDHDDVDCVKQGHLIVLETQPFSFWTEKMSDADLNHFEYYKKQSNFRLQQGELFKMIHNYHMAEQYFQQKIKLPSNKDEELATLYNNLGLVSTHLGKYEEAIKFFSQALKIRAGIYGENHRHTLTTQINIGQALRLLGHYEEALDLHLNALEVLEVNSGPKQIYTINLYNNTAAVYANLKDHKKAIKFYFKSLDGIKRIYGENHPEAATLYNNIGSSYNETAQFKKAVEFSSKSLEILKQVHGDKHPETANSYITISIAHKSLGEFNKARDFLLRALEIYKKIHKDNHPSIAATLINLGDIYSCLKYYDKALEYNLQALEIRKKIFGENHPDTARSYNNSGNVYGHLKKYDKALEFCLKGLKITKSIFGENDISVAEMSLNVATTYIDLGKFEEAKTFQLKALEIFKAKGERHSSMGSAYNGLAVTYSNLGERSEAIKCLNEALKILKEIYGDKHVELVPVYHNLAAEYIKSNQYRKSIEYALKELEIEKSTFGEKTPTVAKLLYFIGSGYNNSGENKIAIEYCSKSVEIWSEIYGENDVFLANVYEILGAAYNNIKEHTMAIKFCLKALEICKEKYGERNVETSYKYRTCGTIYSEARLFHEAIECILEASKIQASLLGKHHPETARTLQIIGLRPENLKMPE